MAIITCKECGSMMSDKASACPECGCPHTPAPMNDYDDNGYNEEGNNGSKKKLGLIIALIVIALCGCGAIAWLIWGNSASGDVKIDKQFTEAVHQYDALYPFSEGMAAVSKNGKFGYINTKGELVIPCKFTFAGPFKDGLACVAEDFDKPIAFVDKDGNVKETKYPFSMGFYGGTKMASAYLSPDLGSLYFNNGVCTINYEKEGEEDFATVYIDKDFKEVAKPTDVAEAAPKNLEYTIFTEKGKDVYGDEIELKGLKNSKGETVIPAKYNDLQLGENGVVLATYYVESAQSHFAPTVPEGKTIQGYLDYAGNSTFTEADLVRIEEYKKEQQTLYKNLQTQEEDRLRREEADRLAAQQRWEEEYSRMEMDVPPAESASYASSSYSSSSSNSDYNDKSRELQILAKIEELGKRMQRCMPDIEVLYRAYQRNGDPESMFRLREGLDILMDLKNQQIALAEQLSDNAKILSELKAQRKKMYDAQDMMIYGKAKIW